MNITYLAFPKLAKHVMCKHQWRTQDLFKGGGGGMTLHATPSLVFLPQKIWVSFPCRHGVGVSIVHHQPLWQAKKKKKKKMGWWGGVGGWGYSQKTQPPPPPQKKQSFWIQGDTPPPLCVRYWQAGINADIECHSIWASQWGRLQSITWQYK